MKKAAVVLLAPALLLINTSIIFAHNMLIEPVEPGEVRVIFDDGTPNRHAEAVVYDESDHEIYRGKVERDGTFRFPPGEAVLIVARDDFGHRAEYVVGEEPQEPLPRLPVTAAVLAGFILLAGIFQYRVNNKKTARP